MFQQSHIFISLYISKFSATFYQNIDKTVKWLNFISVLLYDVLEKILWESDINSLGSTHAFMCQ